MPSPWLKAARHITAFKDAFPEQDKAFAEALQHYTRDLPLPEDAEQDVVDAYMALTAYEEGREEDGLTPAVLSGYRALHNLRETIDKIVANIEENEEQIPQEVKDVLESLTKALKKEISAFEDPASWKLRYGGYVTLAVLLYWNTHTTVAGPDKSFVPLRMPTHARSVFIFINWVKHPSANIRQFGDMFVQRIFVPMPSQLLYTANFIWDIYGTRGYNIANMTASLGIVAGVIIQKETAKYLRKRRVRKAIAALNATDQDQTRGFRRQMASRRGELKLSTTFLRYVREQFTVSPGEGDQFSRLTKETSSMEDFLALIAGLEELAERSNPELKAKIKVLIALLIFGALQLAGVVDNEQSLAFIAAWFKYAFYRVLEFVLDPERTADQTWHLLGQIAGVVPFLVGLHTIPLLALGSNVFSNPAWMYGSTIGLTLLQTGIANKSGPGLLSVLGWPAAIFRFLKSALSTPRPAPSEDVEMQTEGAASAQPNVPWEHFFYRHKNKPFWKKVRIWEEEMDLFDEYPLSSFCKSIEESDYAQQLIAKEATEEWKGFCDWTSGGDPVWTLVPEGMDITKEVVLVLESELEQLTEWHDGGEKFSFLVRAWAQHSELSNEEVQDLEEWVDDFVDTDEWIAYDKQMKEDLEKKLKAPSLRRR